MQSRSRVPEQPLGTPQPRPLVTAGGADADLAAITLLCLMFAWPAEEREQSSSGPATLGA